MQIPQLQCSRLLSSLAGDSYTTDYQLMATASSHSRSSIWVWVRVRVTLRLAVYRQSVRLGAKALEAHDRRYFLQLNSYSHSPCVTPPLTGGWVCLLWICLAFVKRTYRTYSMILKILPFTIYISPLSVQADRLIVGRNVTLTLKYILHSTLWRTIFPYIIFNKKFWEENRLLSLIPYGPH
jgi:hypothetical protein